MDAWKVVDNCPRCANSHRCPIDCTKAVEAACPTCGEFANQHVDGKCPEWAREVPAEDAPRMRKAALSEIPGSLLNDGITEMEVPAGEDATPRTPLLTVEQVKAAEYSADEKMIRLAPKIGEPRKLRYDAAEERRQYLTDALNAALRAATPQEKK